MQLLTYTKKGLHCPQGDFYLDPIGPVDRAIISHAHSDHARHGMGHYLCHTDSVDLLKLRLGNQLSIEGLPYGQPRTLQDVQVCLYPAGHVIGSAQIAITYKGETWVYAGDYKTDFDGFTPYFEPVPCHTFITESTFGLPVFAWDTSHSLENKLIDWHQVNTSKQLNSVIVAYSLGKAQRIAWAFRNTDTQLMVHRSVYTIHELISNLGYQLPKVKLLSDQKKNTKRSLSGTVYIVPPGAANHVTLKSFEPYHLCIASGWMQIRGHKNRANADLGLPLSDHADFYQLTAAIKATGAERVFVTHGFVDSFVNHLDSLGIQAMSLHLPYSQDDTQTDM